MRRTLPRRPIPFADLSPELARLLEQYRRAKTKLGKENAYVDRLRAFRPLPQILIVDQVRKAAELEDGFSTVARLLAEQLDREVTGA